VCLNSGTAVAYAELCNKATDIVGLLPFFCFFLAAVSDCGAAQDCVGYKHNFKGATPDQIPRALMHRSLYGHEQF